MQFIFRHSDEAAGSSNRASWRSRSYQNTQATELVGAYVVRKTFIGRTARLMIHQEFISVVSSKELYNHLST